LTATLSFYPDPIGNLPDLDIGYINLASEHPPSCLLKQLRSSRLDRPDLRNHPPQ
jgi:hypothetical protein